MTATLRRFLAVSSGGAALELALTFPVFILIVIGIFSIGFLLWTENSIQFAADAAARCASVNSNDCGTVTAVQNAAIGWAGGVPITAANVTVNLNTNCVGAIPGNAVAIRYTVTYFVLSTTTAAEACYPTGN